MESYVNKIKLPNSKRWISGNKNIDEFIQSTHQKDRKPILWVPYKDFSDIKRIGDGGFSTCLQQKKIATVSNEDASATEEDCRKPVMASHRVELAGRLSEASNGKSSCRGGRPYFED
ncbi:12713_t:CDS:2 [Cetraspora pellucida]|uniref:12713_t:CDS:1 n=1 Tax=Cetraspora pellucida TaxID=1433469 RepID=A0A9N9FQV5_9GLOM|nr:12713_t:CDS:2 [Cetraspora pellucida]